MTDARTLHTLGIMAAILHREADDHDGSFDADTADDKTAAMRACCLYEEVKKAPEELLLPPDETAPDNRTRDEAALNIMDRALKDLKPYLHRYGAAHGPDPDEVREVFHGYVELEDAAHMLRRRLAAKDKVVAT